MSNTKAIQHGQHLLACITARTREIIPGDEEISDEKLAILRHELDHVFHQWKSTYGYLHHEFFQREKVKITVIRRSTSEFSVGFSEALSHWAQGIMDENFEYYVQPTQPKSPPHRRLKIGLDWDHTCTEDVYGWFEFVKMMVSRGHQVYIVTMRYPQECLDIPQVFLDAVTGLFPTSRQAKKEFMLKQDIPIDVWIDDNPKAIYMNAQQAFGHVSPPGEIPHVKPQSAAEEPHSS